MGECGKVQRSMGVCMGERFFKEVKLPLANSKIAFFGFFESLITLL